jgi:microcystin-dependent protein
MSTPYIGEIRMFGFGTRGAPNGWQACDGSLLAISEYDALFALIGTTYGGDGQVTFGVPDLRGRVPIHQGTGPGLSTYVIGQIDGAETVTLTAAQAAHTHALPVNSAAATTPNPVNAVLAKDAVDSVFSSGAAAVDMHATSVGLSGGNQPHDNMMPTLTVSYCIATQGIFPSQA